MLDDEALVTCSRQNAAVLGHEPDRPLPGGEREWPAPLDARPPSSVSSPSIIKNPSFSSRSKTQMLLLPPSIAGSKRWSLSASFVFAHRNLRQHFGVK